MSVNEIPASILSRHELKLLDNVADGHGWFLREEHRTMAIYVRAGLYLLNEGVNQREKYIAELKQNIATLLTENKKLHDDYIAKVQKTIQACSVENAELRDRNEVLEQKQASDSEAINDLRVALDSARSHVQDLSQKLSAAKARMESTARHAASTVEVLTRP